MKLVGLFSIILLLIVSLPALVGGYYLMADPTGVKIQLPFDWIKDTFLKNYFIPGLILFVINGLLGLVAAIAVILKRTGSVKLILFQGVVIIGWIVIQMLIIDHTFWLQFVYLGIGICLIIISMLLSMNAKKKKL